MAVKEVVVSDISGKEIPEGNSARIIVYEHPDLDGSPVELDADVAETAKIENGRLQIVSLKIVEPGDPRGRRVVLDVASFNKLFKSDLADLLGGARQAGEDSEGTTRQATTRRQPAPRSTPSRATGPGSRAKSAAGKTPRGARVDYSSPAHAGVLHRGRITEAERLFVREHLDQANANRQRARQPAINPEDPKEKKRYGFS